MALNLFINHRQKMLTEVVSKFERRHQAEIRQLCNNKNNNVIDHNKICNEHKKTVRACRETTKSHTEIRLAESFVKRSFAAFASVKCCSCSSHKETQNTRQYAHVANMFRNNSRSTHRCRIPNKCFRKMMCWHPLKCGG